MSPWPLIVLMNQICAGFVLRNDAVQIALDYYTSRNVQYLCYLSCDTDYENKKVSNEFMKRGIRVSTRHILHKNVNLERFLNQRNVNVGVLLDGGCTNMEVILDTASYATLYDAMHMWLVIVETVYSDKYIYDNFQHLNLSINTDLCIAVHQENEDYYKFINVFNFGKIQKNNLETYLFGEWRRDTGLKIHVNEFKYYNRWDFHNLTLRAVSVILDRPRVFKPEMLTEDGFTPGVSSMTKVTSQLLNILKEQHNFRFNYTIVGRWVGSPKENSTLAVTNSLYWKQQDISSTCIRIFSNWLDWMDPFFPPSTTLETKFYYQIPEKGVGDYENRFLTPLSYGVWGCASAAAIACVLVLSLAAILENRPQPSSYAFFSVFAATCQQAYDDGVQILDNTVSSQGRRLTLLVVGLTSMLTYNYYTSSVVSWLLNAAAPTIANLDGLIDSDLELIFEDIGYTRGWLDNPGFYYYSGWKNSKEDELRDKKVTKAKRTVPILQPPSLGIQLMRNGPYAYHTEPYTASQQISRNFNDRELCALGSLQMMPPAAVYIVGQKRSPYKEFFVWSMMRLTERGHVKVTRARVGGGIPSCSGRTPRALALGQAAPAFALLATAFILSLTILIMEIIIKRTQEQQMN